MKIDHRAFVMSYIPSFTSHLDGFLRKHITNLTAALSLVVGVTGIILFFNLAKGPVEAVHEWLGMIFVAAAVLHVVRHRNSFGNLLRQPRTHLLFGLVAMGVAAFVYALPASPPANPFRQIATAAQRAPLNQLAPVIGVSEHELLARLQAGGISAPDSSQSLYGLANTHHTDPMRLMVLALGNPPKD